MSNGNLVTCLTIYFYPDKSNEVLPKVDDLLTVGSSQYLHRLKGFMCSYGFILCANEDGFVKILYYYLMPGGIIVIRLLPSLFFFSGIICFPIIDLRIKNISGRRLPGIIGRNDLTRSIRIDDL